nr:MAG TPA_asm: hypothetical protein [Caudoviricetes sp.]
MKLKTLKRTKVERAKERKRLYGFRENLMWMVERDSWRMIRLLLYGVPYRRPLRPKMYIRASLLARPRRKLSGHHRI